MNKPASRPGVYRYDFLAGLSVALVLFPQSMAYADLAGMPPWHGLYAAAVAPLLAAPFSSSRYLQTGPVAVTSLLTLGALSSVAATGSAHYVAAAALLAVLVGVIRIFIGLLRWGGVVNLMTPAVQRGFTVGAALLIAASQFPAAVGVVPDSGGLLQRAWLVVSEPSSWNPRAVCISLVTICLMRLGRRLHPLFPGVLVAVCLGLAVSAFGMDAGPLLGSVPEARFPPLQLDLPWAEVPTFLVPALIIALVGFAEAAAISRTFADADGEYWNPSRQFVSQGVANVAAGVFSGFPVGGSFSRSSVARIAGGRTRMTGAVTGVLVLVMLPVSSFLSPLPRCVLGAIVLGAIVSLLDPKPLLVLWRESRIHGLVGFLTLFATLWSSPHLEWGVLTGVVAALIARLVLR